MPGNAAAARSASDMPSSPGMLTSETSTSKPLAADKMLQGLDAVLGHEDVVPVGLERAAHQIARCPVVVRQENACHVSAPVWSGSDREPRPNPTTLPRKTSELRRSHARTSLTAYRIAYILSCFTRPTNGSSR